jgi:hypothetical protein
VAKNGKTPAQGERVPQLGIRQQSDGSEADCVAEMQGGPRKIVGNATRELKDY